MAGEVFVDVMRNIANDISRSSYSTDILYGKVISLSPLTIKVDNRFEIDEEFLILSTLVKKKEITLQDNTNVVLWNDLSVGENVILLRHSGGQRFYVLDRR